MNKLFTLVCCLLTSSIFTQSIIWEEVAPMPEAVSNNAVTTALINGNPYIYSFAGIDTSKDWFGIHLKGFRYDPMQNIWDTIPSLPDPMGGKIAAGASTVKNKIYIIGGYHVASDYSEISSKKVHVYDPETNAYLPDGADIPVAIDDHIQAVWRDSLIYIVTGWSNTTNVVNVQIYNPAEDQWLTGTPVPNTAPWKVFGGSGVIIGDTIYYAGGAQTIGSFFPSIQFRKGYINPDDPTQIEWAGSVEVLARGYRMGATTFDGNALWVGGSDVTYNFDAIAYNGSGGVAALDRITTYDPATGKINQLFGQIPAVMDLRGVGEIGNGVYIIAGGMIENQQVSNRTLKIQIDAITDVEELNLIPIGIIPNPAKDNIRIELEGQFDIQIYNIQGQVVLTQKADGFQNINITTLNPGLYTLEILQKGRPLGREKLVIVR